MKLHDRYHIQLNDRRTTITLDTVLSELLAVELKYQPDHPDAHGAIRDWLQKTINEKLGDNIPSGSRLSQWTRKYAIEAIAKPSLMKSLVEYRIE